jgi:hypothetical protein
VDRVIPGEEGKNGATGKRLAEVGRREKIAKTDPRSSWARSSFGNVCKNNAPVFSTASL